MASYSGGKDKVISKEDERDRFVSGKTSMTQAMSDEYTLDDGNDSDGSSSDSSTDSEKTTGRGIDVIVHYKKKIRKKLQEFKKPLYIPLTLEKHLKWKYITKKHSLLQQRMAKLGNISENVTINDGILEIFLKIQKEAFDFDILAKTLEDTLLSDSDSIAVSWFPLKVSHPSTEFLQVLNSVIPHCGIADELYTEMTDTLNSKVLRLVHDVKYTNKANEIINEAEQELDKKIMSKWRSITINLPIVYSHIFYKYEMKRKVRTVSATVLVFFNVMESKDEFNVELRGQRKDLKKVRKWMEEEFINPYCCLELGFDEVQVCKESIDIPSVIMETFERKNYPDLFWTINNHSRKTWICSSKSDEAHIAVQDVKKCVKQTKECKKTTISAEEIENIVEKCVAVNKNKLGKAVSVKVLKEYNKDLAICLTGEEHQVFSINNWFDSYIPSTTGITSHMQMFQTGIGAEYLVPNMNCGNLFQPHISQMRAGPRWQTVRPAQLAGGFQFVSGAPHQLRLTRPNDPTGRGACAAQLQGGPTALNARYITRQSTPQPRPGMVIQLNTMYGRSQQPQALNMQQPVRIDHYRPARASPQVVGQQSINVPGHDALTAAMLAAAPPQEQKQMLGERLFPLIQRMHQELAGKITGMLLEIDNSELLQMLSSYESLKAKVEEAVDVLERHKTLQVATNQAATYAKDNDEMLKE